MWWFLKKAPLSLSNPDPAHGARWLTETQLLAQVPDLGALDTQELALKIWLPEAVAQMLKWVADYEGVSQSGWVREHLLVYVYGHVAALARRIRAERAEHHRPMFARKSVDRQAGRWIYKVPQLGKNTVAFKVWISQQLRDDLDVLATHAGVGLSPFVREAIIGELWGRGSLPERPQILGVPSSAADAWERGEAVPVEPVEEDAFNHLGDAERVWLDAA
jgi:hypothetical protein